MSTAGTVDLVAFIEKEVLPLIDHDDDVMGTQKAVVVRALIAEVRRLRPEAQRQETL